MIRILQQDNRIIKTLIALFIGAAIIAMVITLVPGIFQDNVPTDGTVYATVRNPGWFGKLEGDSKSIKTADVQRQAQQQMQQQNLPPFYLQYVMSRAGQIMVERAVLEREADRMGLQVSNDDLKNFLYSGPYAQYLAPGGKPLENDDQKMNVIQSLFGLPVDEFETEVKSDLEIQRLQAMVTGAVSVSDSAARAEYLKTGTKVKFDYASITAAAVSATINPSDADLQAYFKQSATRYATAMPETRKITFFSFDSSNLPDGGTPQVSDAEVQAYYAQHQELYKTAEQIKTRHILIASAKGADAKTDAAAKAKAEDVLKQVKAGGNFTELAKKYSDDPGSKDAGGELGLQPSTLFVPEFSKAAVALNPGQTSDLVRTQFGYHIIQTEMKEPAHVKTIAEVKPSIVEAISVQKSGAAAQNFGTQLVTEAKKDGLQKTADAHKLHAMTTDFLGRSGVIPSLPDSAALLTAAFGAAKGAAPQIVSTGEGFAIFQVVDVQAAHAPTFAEYKVHLLEDYRQQKTPELLNAQLIKLADRAKVLNDLHKAAAEMNLPVKSSDLVGSDAQVPDIGAMNGAASVAFNLATGGISGPINEGTSGAVLQLTDKQQPSADDIAKNLQTTKDKLLAEKRQEVFGVYIGTLMDRYTQTGAITYTKKQSTLPLGN